MITKETTAEWCKECIHHTACIRCCVAVTKNGVCEPTEFCESTQSNDSNVLTTLEKTDG